MKLHEFNSIDDARAYTVVAESIISASIMKSLMLKIGLYGYFVDHTEDLQRAAAQELFGGSFNFILSSNDNVIGLFDVILSIELDPIIKDKLTALRAIAIARSNVVSNPFSDVTDEEFDACKFAFYNVTVKDINWSNERYLRINLIDDLFEPSNVVTSFSDEIFTNENLGKPKRLDKAGEYIIDLTDVRKVGTLHVNFNINANATCELLA